MFRTVHNLYYKYANQKTFTFEESWQDFWITSPL